MTTWLSRHKWYFLQQNSNKVDWAEHSASEYVVPGFCSGRLTRDNLDWATASCRGRVARDDTVPDDFWTWSFAEKC